MTAKPKMATFKVSESDSSRVMLDKLNAYVIDIKKEKYNNTLKLLNELFEQSNKSLRNFTKIDCEYFESKSLSKLIKILDIHKEKLGLNIDKLKEYYLAKKQNKLTDTTTTTTTTTPTTKETKDITPTTKETKTKSKTKSDTNKKEFTVSDEIFTLISKLIKSLDYKLVKSLNGGKPSYSLMMCT